MVTQEGVKSRSTYLCASWKLYFVVVVFSRRDGEQTMTNQNDTFTMIDVRTKKNFNRETAIVHSTEKKKLLAKELVLNPLGAKFQKTFVVWFFF